MCISMKFNAGCFGRCYCSSDVEIKSFGLTMGWSYGGGVMGQSYGVELVGGVMGQS